MVLRQTACRQAYRHLQPRTTLSSSTPATKRFLAAPSSGSFQYQAGEAAGVKIASRDLAGPTSTLALVAKAGTRYQPLPGLAEGLEKYAFRNTERRSALRLQREAELFGASLFSHHSRESIVIGARFFRDDLPYFVEALAEVATQTKYLDYEFKEQVMDQVHRSQMNVLAHPEELALASAHALAFHRGLGEPLHPTSATPLAKYLSHDAIAGYSTLAYTKPNVAVVGNGVEFGDLSKWVDEYFAPMRTSPAPGVPGFYNEDQSRYFGGEERIPHAKGNTIVLAFPGSSSLTGGFYKPEVSALAALLGGKSSIKWTPGFSLLSKVAAGVGDSSLKINTHSHIYSDAGLLTISITANSADSVANAAEQTVATLRKIADGQGIAEEDFAKARAQARFSELEYGQEPLAGLELSGNGLLHSGQKPYQLDESADKIAGVTVQGVRQVAKEALAFKASVATVGDLWQLPYAAELGLQV